MVVSVAVSFKFGLCGGGSDSSTSSRPSPATSNHSRRELTRLSIRANESWGAEDIGVGRHR